MEKEITEKRVNWITKILKYDIDVNPTKVIWAKGLCEYLTQGPKELGESQDEILLMKIEAEEKGWISDCKLFLQTRGFPPNLPAKKKRFYKLQNSNYQLLEGVLFTWNLIEFCFVVWTGNKPKKSCTSFMAASWEVTSRSRPLSWKLFVKAIISPCYLKTCIPWSRSAKSVNSMLESIRMQSCHSGL